MTGFGTFGKIQNIPPSRYGVSVHAHFDAIDASPSSWGVMSQGNTSLQPAKGLVSGDESSVYMDDESKKYSWSDESWLSSSFELWYVVKLQNGRPNSIRRIFGNNSFAISILTDGKLRVSYGGTDFDSTYAVIHPGESPWLILRTRVNKGTNTLHFEMNRIEIAGIDGQSITGLSYSNQSLIDVGCFFGHIGFLIAHNDLLSDTDRDTTEAFLIQEI